MSDQPRGILKRDRIERNSTQKLHFDEEELEKYDQTRGKTQKIIEPKTPFIHMDSNDEILGYTGEIAPIELSHAIIDANNKKVEEDAWDSEDDEEKEEDVQETEEEKHKRFEALRHQHYDMKAALQNKKGEQEDEESDE